MFEWYRNWKKKRMHRYCAPFEDEKDELVMAGWERLSSVSYTKKDMAILFDTGTYAYIMKDGKDVGIWNSRKEKNILEYLKRFE